MSESTDQKVVAIIAELFDEVRKTSGAIDETGVTFWTNHYTPLFKNAIDRKRRKYPDDRPMLMRKARALAAAARRHAANDPITAVHAEEASKEVDCRCDATRKEPVDLNEYWCY